MRILVLLLLLVLVGVMTIRIGAFLWRRGNRAKWRISLRGLLVLVAVVAVILACTIGYRRVSMASLRWIATEATEAEQLFPVAKVYKNDQGRFEFVYYASNRSVQRLLTRIDNASYSVGEEAVQVTTRTEAAAHQQLKNIRDFDKLPDGAFVIRGRVRDKNGEPLAGAIVDILGRFVFVNCFKTRDDGTFTLPLTDQNSRVPAGSGYYFRIRAPSETADHPIRWHSRYFSLDPSNRVMVADIRVPE